MAIIFRLFFLVILLCIFAPCLLGQTEVELRKAIDDYYKKPKVSKILLQENAIVAKDFIRSLIYDGKARHADDERRYLQIIVLLDGKKSLGDLIYASRCFKFISTQELAIRLMGEIKHEGCVPFLYDFLEPNDLRVIDAIQVLQQFDTTDFDKLVPLAFTDPDEFLGPINDEVRSRGCFNVKNACAMALSFSRKEKYIDVLHRLAQTYDDPKKNKAGYARFMLKMYHAEDRDEQFRMYLKGPTAPNYYWILTVLEREGRLAEFNDAMPAWLREKYRHKMMQ